MTLFAGVDIGTTSVKGVVLDQTGTVMRSTLSPLPELESPLPGRIEQDPDGIVASASHVLETLWPFDAAALVGQINSHIFLDEEGTALTAVISWADSRAAGFAGSSWRPSSLVSRVAWLEAVEPELLERASIVLLPRDYVALRLGGNEATEASSWPDLTDDGVWRTDVPTAVTDRLPLIVEPTAILTTFRGAPIFAGCMDSLAAVLGCGPTPPGTAIDVGGTSESVGTVFESPEHVPAVRGVIRLPDGWWHAGPSHTGGRTLTWAANAFGFPGGEVERLLDSAAAAAEAPTGLVFVPYLDGERMPLWDPDAVGGLIGLHSHHDQRSIARATLEGVAFAIRHILDVVQPIGQAPVQTLLICGGTARSQVWNQIKADVVGVPTFVPTDPDTGVLGAAMIAAAGMSNLTVAEVRALMAPNLHELRPNPANHAQYSGLHQQYVRLTQTLKASGDPSARSQSEVEATPDQTELLA